MKPVLNIEGTDTIQIWDALGSVAYHVFKHLNKLIPCKLKVNIPQTDWSEIPIEDQNLIIAAAQLPDAKYALITKWPEYWTDVKNKIVWSLWETDTVPAKWIEGFKQAKAIITSSEWNANLYRSHGIKTPIYIVPWGTEKLSVNQGQKVNGFCCSSSLYHRKNFDGVVRAISKLKIPGVLHYKLKAGSLSNVQNLIDNSPQISVNNQKLSKREYANLISRYKVFVSASGGEGWNIPPRQALQAGCMPVVSANTANMVLVNGGGCVPLKATRNVVTTHDILPWGSVCFPAEAEIAEGVMKAMSSEPEQCHTIFSWEESIKMLAEVLKQIIEG